MSDAELSSLAPNLMREVAGVAARAPWARVERVAEVLLLACVAALGAWAGYKLTPQPVHENVSAAPEVKQADGSIELARAPDAHPAPPPHIIPKGFHEERREQFTVAPAPAAAASGCPPVRIALSVVSDDRQHRVIASSPDGQIVDAVDIPIQPVLMPPAPRPWAAGLAYGTDHSVGVWLERDVGRLRVGVEVAKGAGPPRAEIRVGVAF